MKATEMQIGIYSFGNTQKGSTHAESIRNLMEAVRLAEDVGLDFFGFGEHHLEYFPISSPATLIAAAASVTTNIILSSAVTVLSTDDPVRVYQQFATADIISNQRVEIIAGRGSFVESFPLFGHSLKQYDELFEEKLDLLVKINEHTSQTFSWKGKHRSPIDNAVIVPRPVKPLDIWIATGGNPESTARAAYMHLPIVYAIIGGSISRFQPLTEMYRSVATTYNMPADKMNIAIASPGYIARDAGEAKDTFWKTWGWVLKKLGKLRGFAPPTREHFDNESNQDGALFAGSPEEIIERIVHAHSVIGHSRHAFQMDVGQLPHKKFLESIKLLGNVVAPEVKRRISSKEKN